MERRDLFKLTGLGIAAAATTTLTGCAGQPDAPSAMMSAKSLLPKSTGKRVVIIGGGFGGLTAAKYLRKQDKSVEVIVLEKRDIFMSCPFSNSLLGGLEDVTLDTLTHDLYSGASNHGYELIQSTVTDIDANKKMVHTNLGSIDYDILLLSPGIAYDYKGQFPTWSDAKIREVQQKAPAAMMAGSEHLALKRMLDDMDDGNIIITKPNGKYRCPPAPFERASMIANYMEKEEIEGKVIILNSSEGISKGAAFKESWKDLYSSKLEHRDNCTILDVDFDKGIITYNQVVGVDKDEEDILEKKTEKFAVLNLIPQNIANPVVQMAGVETTNDSFGKVKMNGASFRTKSHKDIYAVGDVVGHAIPPSGQTANWSAKQAAGEIIAALNGKSYKLDLPYKTANVCFSMVGDGPEEAIMVTHDFSFNGSVIKGKGNVPKTGGTKYRSKNTAKATREWYRGIMDDMFL